jgi:hypothetical protein
MFKKFKKLGLEVAHRGRTLRFSMAERSETNLAIPTMIFSKTIIILENITKTECRLKWSAFLFCVNLNFLEIILKQVINILPLMGEIN